MTESDGMGGTPFGAFVTYTTTEIEDAIAAMENGVTWTPGFSFSSPTAATPFFEVEEVEDEEEDWALVADIQEMEDKGIPEDYAIILLDGMEKGCDWFFGSHGCDRVTDHSGLHTCGCGFSTETNEDWWYMDCSDVRARDKGL